MMGSIIPPPGSASQCSVISDAKPADAKPSALATNLNRTAPPSYDFAAMPRIQEGVLYSVSSDSSTDGDFGGFLALLKE